MNEQLFILTVKNTHTQTTRAEFVSGLESRGATVQFGKSRLGDFDVVKVNGHAVARAFSSKEAMLGYMARSL